MSYYRSTIQDPTRRPQSTNNVVGMVAIVVAMLDLVGQVLCGGFSGQGYAAAAQMAGTTDFDVNDSSIQGPVNRWIIGFLVWIVLWLISIVPFVLGILGVRKPPRSMGIVAIVLSVLAPVLAIIVWLMFTAKAMNL